MILERIARGEFIVSVQIDPPGTCEIFDFKKTLSELRKVGVEVLDVNSSRRLSHDAIHLSSMLTREGFETIPHVTMRDSSLNGLLNQAIAAHAWGKVNTFLLITGDPYETSQTLGPGSGVFHTNSIGMLTCFDTHLRKNPKLNLSIELGAVVNQNESDIEEEGRRIILKKNAGADFFMSQPVFDIQQTVSLCGFYKRYSDKPLLVGVWPLTHPKTLNAIYKGVISGVAIPHHIYEEAKTLSEEKLYEWGLENAYNLVGYIKEHGMAEGVYIVAPLRNPLLLVPLLKKIF